MKKVIISLLTIFFIGCSLSPKKESRFTLDYPKELEEVHGLIIEKKTADARLKVEDYINKAENIHWYGHAYFLKGFLYELDENFPQAIKFYRSAIQHGSQYESKVEAKALYNLSFVYEHTDNRKELLISLIDLMKRRSFFDILTGQVEIPARLAAAYASQGKMKEALIFHREASRNFTDMVRNQKFRAKKSEISKSLYYLGLATYDTNNEKFGDLVSKLSHGQKYFLSAAEASKSTWSQKAMERVQSLYTVAWGMVQEYAPQGLDHDPLAFKKQKQRRQLSMASELYDLLFKLRAEEFPMGNVNPRSKAIVDSATAWIAKIEQFAVSLNVGPEMIRNKKIKNKRLARYIDEEVKKVKVNKEQVDKKTRSDSSAGGAINKLPEKKEIGKDPNL